MKVLFTTPVLEYPAAGGPQLRIETSIKALSQVCELDIIARTRPSACDAKFYQQFSHEFHYAPSGKNQSSNRYLRKLSRILSALGGGSLQRDADFILEHVKRRNIDAIWFGFGNISYPLIRLIKTMRPDLKVICDTDSVWSRFILRRLPYARGIRRAYIAWSGAKKEDEERAWVNLCEITTAVSEVDAEYYRGLAADTTRVRIFSNVIDMAAYASKPTPPAGLRKPAIYLAGTFGHYNSPMDVAARWVIEEILPLVRESVPDIHLYIVGNQSDRMFGHISDPGITVTGKLPSVLPYLCNIDIALVPLKFESGTRFKILEAGACSIPLVSTTLGAEGIPVIDGEHILIADDANTFASAITHLLNDKAGASRLAQNCQALVRRHYSVEALRAEALTILGSLVN